MYKVKSKFKDSSVWAKRTKYILNECGQKELKYLYELGCQSIELEKPKKESKKKD